MYIMFFIPCLEKLNQYLMQAKLHHQTELVNKLWAKAKIFVKSCTCDQYSGLWAVTYCNIRMQQMPRCLLLDIFALLHVFKHTKIDSIFFIIMISEFGFKIYIVFSIYHTKKAIDISKTPSFIWHTYILVIINFINLLLSPNTKIHGLPCREHRQ